MLPPLWMHQQRGIEEFFRAAERGQRRVCLTSPTGGGKTRTLTEIVKRYLADRRRVVWFTNRRMLLEQTSTVFQGHGLVFGKRAAGHFPELHHDFQLASIQTERVRTLGETATWDLHEADLAIFDEAHLMANHTAAQLMGRYLDHGATILGATATPIGLGDFYDELVVAGTNSELRACGALVRASHFGPDEPDLRQIGTLRPGEDLSENEQRKLMGSVGKAGPDVKIKALFGRVLEWWRKLNPKGKPTILFAPGVKESLWFAQQFYDQGVSAAHIDGEEVWCNGTLHRSNRDIREDVLRGSRDGRIRILCNRFVLREGIDAPWLAHGILATVFGSLQSYLQSGGRLLRSAPGLRQVCVQDHGGNFWKHLSLNMDREWSLDMTNSSIAQAHADRMREHPEKQPVCCPQCRMILLSLRCPCGFVVTPQLKTRPVIQADGSLIEYKGDYFPARVEQTRPDTEKLWQKMYLRAWQSGMTFNQARGKFCLEQFYWPPKTLALMPRDGNNWCKKVKAVDEADLNGPVPAWLAQWKEKRRKVAPNES